VDLSTGLVKCSGTIQCATLITTNVVASTYTPGAGNILRRGASARGAGDPAAPAPDR
jgi:hypothetical protein